MVNLALWLKSNNYRCDQVQNFYPSPMCNATAMYHAEVNPLKRVKYKKPEKVPVAKGEAQRRLHKALLRYHDPANWPMIREALIAMGKRHLIGDRPECLIPEKDSDLVTPAQSRKSGRHGANRFATKHTHSQPGFDALRGNKSGGQGRPNSGNKSNQGKPAGSKPTGSKPTANKPAGNQPARGEQNRGQQGQRGSATGGKPQGSGRPASRGNTQRQPQRAR